MSNQKKRQKKKTTTKNNNNDLQTTTQKTNDCATRIPITIWGKLRCFGKVSCSCSTCYTCDKHVDKS